MIKLRFIVLAPILAAALLGPAPPAGSTEPSGTESLSQCPSGYFCVWSGTNYTGSMQQFSATGSYKQITLSTIRSLYNRRSARTYLHETSGGSGYHSCYGPGATSSSLLGWRQTAEAAWLSTVTSC